MLDRRPHRLIVGAPVGNSWQPPGAIPELGSFTLEKRDGVLGLRKLWKVATTLRYSRRAGGWINKLGLPNPGVRALRWPWTAGKIISLFAFKPEDWNSLLGSMGGLIPAAVTANFSCPNVGHAPEILAHCTALRRAAQFSGFQVIAKLPPVGWRHWLEHLDPLWAIHCCNTLPVPGGGLSGAGLKRINLDVVEAVRKLRPDAVLVGGGGISTPQDAQDYLNAGADHVAVCSLALDPLGWLWGRPPRRVRAILAHLDKQSQLEVLWNKNQK